MTCPGPQSNQRGIETDRQQRSREQGYGLNRTSVGLKRKWTLSQKRASSKPQSNQRGIETALPDPVGQGPPGLNRTSVGLKRSFLTSILKAKNGLNRTSVGLKLRGVDAP